MKKWCIAYTDIAIADARTLPPDIKPTIKSLIEELQNLPNGKPLQLELTGYFRVRYQNWRIIYELQTNDCVVIIQMIRRRSVIYADMELLLGHRRGHDDENV